MLGFFISLSLFLSYPKGTTGEILWEPEKIEEVPAEKGKLTIGAPPSPVRQKLICHKDGLSDWDPIDSVSFYGSIPAGRSCLIRIKGNLTVIFPDTLISKANEAVNAVPKWLKLSLHDNFVKMDEITQIIYADIILTVPALHMDEVAFCIAHIDPGILANSKFYSELITENVRLIYKVDSLLDYVKIVEYPDYSTTKYKMSDHGKDTTEIEIPKEMYYWYVVHPILEYEAPLYINPKTADPSRNGAGITSPSAGGVLWRYYLFNYPDTAEKTVWAWRDQPDTIYAGDVSPILKEELSGEKILWNGKRDTIPDNSAIGIITKWIKDVMVFNSYPGDCWNNERPWQPVRIYHMHRGRCGEQAHLTAATGRTCLIPTNSAGALMNDHIWNEFWDTEWYQWEPVNTMINDPDRYDPGWWELGGVFIYRGDGYLWDATQRYTPICTLTVDVKDANDVPVDGARILVGKKSGQYFFIASAHSTGVDGRVDCVIGDNNKYYVRIDSYIGNVPATLALTNETQAGKHYTWTQKLTGTMPDISVTQDTVTSGELYKIEVDFSVPEEIRHARVFQNEFRIAQNFAQFVEPGDIEFFVSDSINISKYQDGGEFKAHCIGRGVDSGSVSFVIPTEGEWYTVFSNKDQLKTGQVISFTAKLYKNVGVEETEQVSQWFTVSPVPFISSTSIDFMMPQKTRIDLGMYDLAGRCVKQIFKEKIVVGHHQINLDGREFRKGVYFIRLVTPNKTITEKIIKL